MEIRSISAPILILLFLNLEQFTLARLNLSIL